MDSKRPCHLLRLPLELREAIYKYHFSASYGHKLDENSDATMREPPLTRTCKRLRAETLPIWYATQRVMIKVVIKRHPDGENSASYERRIWQSRLPPAKMKMVRRLKVIYHYRPNYGFGVSFVRIIFSVDLSAHSHRVTFHVEHRAWEGDITDFELDANAEGKRLMTLMKETLDSMLADPGVGNFTAADLDRLAHMYPERRLPM